MKQKMKMIVGLIVALALFIGSVPLTADAAMPEYYGRQALSKLDNADALLYAYDQLVDGVENVADQISVYNGKDSFLPGELQFVIDAYIKDHPEHFWVGKEYHYATLNGNVVKVSLKYIMNGDKLQSARNAFEAKVQQVLSGVKKSMSDYEKAVYLHDQVASMVVYQESPNAHNAYGALIEGVSVCEGYAESYQYLLQRAGIKSFIATGQSRSQNHEWNYVYLDGAWYHVDVTWDDQGEDLYHAYFGLSDEAIKRDHFIFDQDYDLPVCNSEEGFYFNGTEQYLNTYSVESIAKLLKKNHYKVHVYVPGNTNSFVQWYNDNALNIVKYLELYGRYSYGVRYLGNEVILLLIVEGQCVHEDYTVTEEKESTCSSKGWDEYYLCHDCGKMFDIEWDEITDIPERPLADEHTFKLAEMSAQTLKTPGTCKDAAVYYYSCEGCGKVSENAADTFEGAKDASNHVGGTEVVGYLAADHKNQTAGYTGDEKCLGCNVILEKGEEIKAGDHVPSLEWKTDGTYHWKECSVAGCGVILEETKAAHSSTGENKATCDMKAICDHCYALYGDVLEHAYTKEVKNAETLKTAGNCKEEAVYYYSCEYCGKISNAEADTFKGEKDLANHTGDTEVIGYVEANHKEQVPGYTGDVKCLGCNVILEEGQVIGADEHMPSLEWESDGTHHWKVCSVDDCGVILEDTKASHSSTGENAATCKEKAVCDYCHVEYGEVAAHESGDWEVVKPATKEETGLRQKCCETCGIVLEEEEIPMLDDSALPGDANGDGKIDGKDVIAIRRALAEGYDVVIDEVASDVNDDGVVNGKDVIAIRRFLAGGYGVVLK